MFATHPAEAFGMIHEKAIFDTWLIHVNPAVFTTASSAMLFPCAFLLSTRLISSSLLPQRAFHFQTGLQRSSPLRRACQFLTTSPRNGSVSQLKTKAAALVRRLLEIDSAQISCLATAIWPSSLQLWKGSNYVEGPSTAMSIAKLNQVGLVNNTCVSIDFRGGVAA